MLVLVQGVKAHDVILRELLSSESNIVVLAPLPECTLPDLWTVKLTTRVKRVILILATRLFKLTASQYDAVRECVLSSSSLGEAIDKLGEVVYDNVDIKLLRDLLPHSGKNLDVISGSSRLLLKVPVEEPYRTFIALALAYALTEFFPEATQSKTLVLSLDRVDEVYDLILPLRKYRTYILSLAQVRRAEIFDIVYVQTTTDRGIQILKLAPERVISLKPSEDLVQVMLDSDITISSGRLDLVQTEILTLLRELGFMNLQSLRDSVSQNLNVSKSDVDLAIARLRSLGLIEVRFLPDGRVLVYPTVLGLVKATVTGDWSKRSSGGSG